MCRWLAYCGPSIFLDALVFKPENSLIRQSLHALQSHSPTNGDGFGIGWYDSRPEPGVYRDTLPAWNDQNLRSLCGQIRARLFFGHVRASTGTATARSNCHPFKHGRWLFMHNGAIGGYERLRRQLSLAVPEVYFPAIEGTTDSELLFYLLLGNGLDGDPLGAIGRTLAQVRGIAKASGVDEPLRFTAALTDGETLYAVRYSSDAVAPSLYYGCGARPCLQDGEPAGDIGRAILVLSEPLDHAAEQWTAVPPSHLLIAGDGGVGVQPLELRAAA